MITYFNHHVKTFIVQHLRIETWLYIDLPVFQLNVVFYLFLMILATRMCRASPHRPFTIAGKSDLPSIDGFKPRKTSRTRRLPQACLLRKRATGNCFETWENRRKLGNNCARKINDAISDKSTRVHETTYDLYSRQMVLNYDIGRYRYHTILTALFNYRLREQYENLVVNPFYSRWNFKIRWKMDPVPQS